MVPLVKPLVPMVMPMVPLALPMVPFVSLVSQWCHWLPLVKLNPGRFGPGSFRPGSFRPGSFRPNFGVGHFGLGRWVVSALGRFGRSLYQNVDCLGLTDKQVDR